MSKNIARIKIYSLVVDNHLLWLLPLNADYVQAGGVFEVERGLLSVACRGENYLSEGVQNVNMTSLCPFNDYLSGIAVYFHTVGTLFDTGINGMEEGSVGDIPSDNVGEGIIGYMLGIVVLAPVVEDVALGGRSTDGDACSVRY